jgi:predicted acylesterase/phospholipase RssA
VGLTLIQRSQGRPPRTPRIALVLAGGAITGGAFKLGGLQALDECLVGRTVTEFDTYVGLSAGSFLAVALASGVGPAEMIAALDGRSALLEPLRPIDFYRPNAREALERVVHYAGDLAGYVPDLLRELWRALPELPASLQRAAAELRASPTWPRVEALLEELWRDAALPPPPSPARLIPSGIFDNAPLARWLAAQLERLGLPDDFAELQRRTGRRLYVSATELDSAEAVIFGPEDSRGLTISQAVQASSALPGFMRPARFNGIDYIDGGVRRTADLEVAAADGADLIICYNPFRPFLNDPSLGGGRLADRGLPAVLNQTFRALLHTRLDLGLSAFLRDETFRGDIVLIEARETDAQFFDLNPLVFWKREAAVEHGLVSVRRTLADAAERLAPVFARCGLEFRPPAAVPAAREAGLRLAAAPA